MAHLIAHRLNGAWKTFWASQPLRRAAQMQSEGGYTRGADGLSARCDKRTVAL